MSRNRLTIAIALVVAFSMVLASCAPKATTTTPPTAVVEPTKVPYTFDSVPARVPGMGGYLDEIDYSVVDASSVITQISAGAVDLFSYGLASDKLQEIKDAGLCYSSSYGLYYGFLFNPAVFTDTTKLNPFSNRKMREAMNWAIDRNYINQEVYAGGALPKFTPLTTQLVDYTGVIDVARGLEAKYAYDLAKAQAVVDTEMPLMGATKDATTLKWMFNDAPITLIFLIRNDGDLTRLPQGEYFAQQLENLGFTVDRQEKKSSELSPLWIQSDPYDGLWSIYTSGWASNGLNRDEKTIFQEMYLSDSPQGMPVFLANVNDPAYTKVGDDLANGNFTSLEQRHDMIVEALPLALEDSLQVWTVDLQSFSPFDCKLQVSADVGAGVETTKMTPLNLLIKDQDGGQVKIASTDTMFTDPWNPVNGSNWVTSAFIQNAISSQAFMPDPYTGLSWPWQAESADVTVQTGLPVGKTLDWVTLTFADQIDVPADAWADWDATTQTFIPAGEGVTAKTKVVVHYPADLFTKVKWHDSTNLSVADFVMGYIMAFDEAKPESAIYDESIVPNYEAFMSHFKGIQIESTDPFTVAIYDDGLYADAELIVSSNPLTVFLWPQYGFGEAPWEAIAVANMAEANKELAYSIDKADANEIEWMSWIGGPSLDILANDLDMAIADNTIPYAPTMGQYITADDAAERYAALKFWYESHGNFYDNTGEYYLDSVDLNAFSAVVKNNGWYPDPSDRWAAFGEAPLGVAALEGPTDVKIGDAVDFTASFTNKNTGDPYPSAEINEVKFLIYDDKGTTVFVGTGVATATDGVFTLTVPADVTSTLVAGSGRIEVAGVFIPVAIPAFTTLDYVVVP
jgi:peptide/nickel transport system substrate-binding protein